MAAPAVGECKSTACPRARALELPRGPILPTALWYLLCRVTGEFRMPEHAALIAVLIMERPLCVSCISSKTGLTHGEIESYLARIENTVDVKQALDSCR